MPWNWYRDNLLRQNKKHCHVVPTDVHLAFLKEVLSLVAPDVKVLTLPEWDTVPYDRVSPKSDIEGERIDTLCYLANNLTDDEACLLLTTPAGLVQKVPEKAFFKERLLAIEEGKEIDFEQLKLFLQKNSYKLVNTVINTGEYAIRGGLIDIFPAGALHPVRIDFFGNEVDEIKFFDEMTQRTLKKADVVYLCDFTSIEENEVAYKSLCDYSSSLELTYMKGMNTTNCEKTEEFFADMD